MRLRVTFAKTGSLRYIGHLDLHQIWERTARRAGLPLAYTQGFHPGPKIQIAAALPLGFLGRAELVDMWLNMENDDLSSPAGMRQRILEVLQNAAPPGLTIISTEPVDEHAPALQTQVVAAEYEVRLFEAGEKSTSAGGSVKDEPREESSWDAEVEALLAKPSLPREWRGKPYDLRPLILSLATAPLPGGKTIRMVLSACEGATGRPEEVLAELGVPIEQVRIERTRLIFKSGIE